MTTEALIRYHCDAPACDVHSVTRARVGELLPQGWTEVSSTDHLGPKTARTTQAWRAFDGEFEVHLCPAHPAVFDDHQPKTLRSVWGAYVSCSCGAALGRASTDREPDTKRAWAQHLPAELQWFAAREAVADVLR